MVNKNPLKDKIMQYEQDYIESSIKWKLELGDHIFKKIDVKRAVIWLKSEIGKNSDDGKNIPLTKIESILNEAFSDAIKRTNKKIEQKNGIGFKETELFKILFTNLEPPKSETNVKMINCDNSIILNKALI